MSSKQKWLYAMIAGIALVAAATGCVDGPLPLTAAGPGVATEGEALLIALPLVNAGDEAASDIRATAITLERQRLVRPSELPLSVDALAGGGTAVLQLAFEAEGLEPGRGYVLRLEGTASLSGSTRRFHLEQEIQLPQAAEGEQASKSVTVESRRVEGGGFEPAASVVDIERVNRHERPPLPEGLHGTGVAPQNPPIGIESLVGEGGEWRTGSRDATDEPITFLRAGTQDVDPCCVLEPSGQSVDVLPAFGGSLTRLVLLTGNFFHLLLSTDGGSTFTQTDAPTVFGDIPLDGLPEDIGFCCDNNLIYIPSIDRIVWQMLTRGSQVGVVKDENGDEQPVNGMNRLRIATASPLQVISSGATAWTYWDMTTATFGFSKTAFLDYPSLAYTDDYLYVGVTKMPDNAYFVARMPLADVQNGGVIHIGFTDSSHGSTAPGARMAQDCPDSGYWFGQASDRHLRIFEWLDGSSSYSWHTLEVYKWIGLWAAGTHDSMTPDNTNWLAANINAVRGATCSDASNSDTGAKRTLLTAWNAGRGGEFPQPYVRLQGIVKSGTTWTALKASAIWNEDFAFHHAHLATNVNGEVGVSVAAGGGGAWDATPYAGFVGDSTLYSINVSSASDSRWGDYTAIRPHWPNSKLFSVSDYFLVAPFPAGIHQYRLFGRTADVGSTF